MTEHTTAEAMRQLATATGDLPEPLNVTICNTGQVTSIRVQVAYGDAAQWQRAADEVEGSSVTTFAADDVMHWECGAHFNGLPVTLTWVQWVRPDEGWDRDTYVGLVAGA